MLRFFYILFFFITACVSVEPKKPATPPVIQVEKSKTVIDSIRLQHPEYSHVSSCEWKGNSAGIYALTFNLKTQARLTVLSAEKIYFETGIDLQGPKDFLTIYCDSFAKVKNFIEGSHEEGKEQIQLQIKKDLFKKIPLDNPILSFSRASSIGIQFYYFDGSSFQALAQILPKVETNGKRHN